MKKIISIVVACLLLVASRAYGGPWISGRGGGIGDENSLCFLSIIVEP